MKEKEKLTRGCDVQQLLANKVEDLLRIIKTADGNLYVYQEQLNVSYAHIYDIVH